MIIDDVLMIKMMLNGFISLLKGYGELIILFVINMNLDLILVVILVVGVFFYFVMKGVVMVIFFNF